MPFRETTLSNLLLFGTDSVLKPSYADFANSALHPEIQKVYKKLNGQLETYPVQYRGFDIKLPGCVVEFDEEQHFNRYRQLTLNSTIYEYNNSFSTEEYKTFCVEFENQCLNRASYGKYWKTNSTENQFGESSGNGMLEENGGSSRWKQRAFYDFLRDAGQQVGNYKLIRVSIHEVIGDTSVREILGNNLRQYFADLVKMIEQKRIGACDTAQTI
ncbi:MAG: hypothetical protein WKF92_02740 [Pyrinomonadaceae bacterium]